LTHQLPPGQIQIERFPRFGTHLNRPAPRVPDDPEIQITGATTTTITVRVADLATMPRRQLHADFHCVAGWTATGLRWEGVPFASLYRSVIEPVIEPGATITHIVFGGFDGHESALLLEDALEENVLVADRLNREPLNADHGAPVRLFSPDQYGYMSTKHLCRIEVRTSAPRRLGAAHPIASLGLRGPFILRHPRARVWHEERHPFLPARVLRPLYRPIIQRGIRISGNRRAHLRLPNEQHTSQPWRIHELTPDFQLEDVWELPGVRGDGGFGRLVERIAAFDLSESSSAAVRALVSIRLKLGELLRLDAGVGSRVTSLRDRLPADLREGPRGPQPTALPAESLYLTDDEWAIEVANETVHAVLHLGRVPDSTGGFRARLAVLVKPNGRLGSAYLAAIRPFRYAIVYPTMLRELASEPTPVERASEQTATSSREGTKRMS